MFRSPSLSARNAATKTIFAKILDLDLLVGFDCSCDGFEGGNRRKDLRDSDGVGGATRDAVGKGFKVNTDRVDRREGQAL
jgi:hypothetical protein